MTSRIICLAALGLFIFGWVGCVKPRPVGDISPDREEIAGEERDEPEQPAGPSPRILASLKLTDQGRQLIEAGQADSAIRVLEQAISLNPGNGQNYYYLSEAWLMKGFAAEARQFNRLAESHLAGAKEWQNLVSRQAERIVKLEDKIKKTR